MEPEARISIVVGGTAPPLMEQLRNQGVRMRQKTKVDSLHWQRLAQSIVSLYVNGLLTEREKEEACRRLIRKITAELKRSHRKL